ncbi:MAG: hypothetical protein JRN20_21510 [Nitrososphaerota archaeon]|nr:hypothetical protein [Nitrososphaerota archaeon]
MTVNFKRRAAVTDVLTTIILIGIAVVAAAGIYIIFVSTSGTALSTTVIYITGAQATYIPTTDATVLSITVKNAGTISISSLSLSVDGILVNSVWQPSPPTLPIQGGSSATTFVLMSGSGWAQGTTHVITITAVSASSGDYTATQDVSVF